MKTSLPPPAASPSPLPLPRLYDREWNPIKDPGAPLKWRKRSRVLVDPGLFAEGVSRRTIDDAFAVMVTQVSQTFILPTDNPKRMAEYFSRPLADVWTEILRSEDDERAFQTSHLSKIRGILRLLDSWELRGEKLNVPDHLIPPKMWPLHNVIPLALASTQIEVDERVPGLLQGVPAAHHGLWLRGLGAAVDVSSWIGDYWCNRCKKHALFPASDRHCPNCGHEGNDWDDNDEPCPGCATVVETEMICPRCGIDGGNGGLDSNECWEKQSLSWVIVEGGDEPLHPIHVRAIRDQCREAGVPFWFGGWGRFQPYVDPARFTHGDTETGRNYHTWMTSGGIRGDCWIYDDDGSWTNWTGDPPCGPDGQITKDVTVFSPVGRARSGRTLDGREWTQTPWDDTAITLQPKEARSENDR